MSERTEVLVDSDHEDTLPSQESGSSSQRKRRYTVLNDLFNFRKASDNRNDDAKCKGCNKVFLKSKNNRLIEHARLCFGSDRELVDRLIEIHDSFEEARLLRAPEGLHSRQESDELQALRETNLVDLIATDSLPLSLVDSDSFKRFANSLDASFKTFSQRRLTAKLLPVRALSIWDAAISRHRAAPSHSLTLELDGWTSVNGVGLMAVVLTTRLGGSMLIDLVDITPLTHTSENLSDLAAESYRKSGLPLSKLNCIITDEASNFWNARPLIRNKLGAKHLIEYRCLAHVYNLIGGYMSEQPVIKRNLKMLLDLINCLSRSQKLVAKLRESGANKLVRPVPTRWYSTSAALNSVLDIKPILETIPRTIEYGFNKRGQTLEDDWFWVILKDLRVYFNYLSRLIGQSETCDSSLGSSFCGFLEFGKFLTITIDREIRFREDALRAYITHFNRLNLDLMFAAYALDPNNRLKYLTDRAIKKAKQFMIVLLFDMGHANDAGRVLLKEFERYLREMQGSDARVDDVHAWWEASNTTVLKLVATRLAACHASSANTERIFSGLGRIWSPARNRLNLKSVYELMVIKIDRLSRKSVKDRKKASSATGQNPTLDELVQGLNLEDTDSEWSILDPRFVETAGEDDAAGSSQHDEFLQSAAYIDFKSFVDFSRMPLEEFVASSPSSGRSSDQRARELLASLESGDRLESD